MAIDVSDPANAPTKRRLEQDRAEEELVQKQSLIAVLLARLGGAATFTDEEMRAAPLHPEITVDRQGTAEQTRYQVTLWPGAPVALPDLPVRSWD